MEIQANSSLLCDTRRSVTAARPTAARAARVRRVPERPASRRLIAALALAASALTLLAPRAGGGAGAGAEDRRDGAAAPGRLGHGRARRTRSFPKNTDAGVRIVVRRAGGSSRSRRRRRSSAPASGSRASCRASRSRRRRRSAARAPERRCPPTRCCCRSRAFSRLGGLRAQQPARHGRGPAGARGRSRGTCR